MTTFELNPQQAAAAEHDGGHVLVLAGAGTGKTRTVIARAAVLSAKAQLERARTDLERTRIRAPYEGQVLEQNVDVGQFVSPGTVLGRVYATDYVEIRLPLSSRQLAFVD